jgi:hypothetical protein
MFDITLDLDTLRELRAERQRCDEFIEAELNHRQSKAESDESRSTNDRNKTVTTATQHRIMEPLSPARAGYAENSVPLKEGWVEAETRQPKNAQRVVVGFEA